MLLNIAAAAAAAADDDDDDDDDHGAIGLPSQGATCGRDCRGIPYGPGGLYGLIIEIC